MRASQPFGRGIPNTMAAIKLKLSYQEDELNALFEKLFPNTEKVTLYSTLTSVLNKVLQNITSLSKAPLPEQDPIKKSVQSLRTFIEKMSQYTLETHEALLKASESAQQAFEANKHNASYARAFVQARRKLNTFYTDHTLFTKMSYFTECLKKFCEDLAASIKEFAAASYTEKKLRSDMTALTLITTQERHGFGPATRNRHIVDHPTGGDAKRSIKALPKSVFFRENAQLLKSQQPMISELSAIHALFSKMSTYFSDNTYRPSGISLR